MNENELIKIGWIARVNPLPDQEKELKRLHGNVHLIHFNQTFKSAIEIRNEIDELKINTCVVILPLTIISELLKTPGIIWLYPVMEKLGHSCNDPHCKEYKEEKDVILKGRHLRFKEFRRIVKVDIILEEYIRMN